MTSMSRKKALSYAKYRLPYSAKACEYIIDATDVSHGVVADIGAGTGLLTQHFVGKVRKIIAIEPELEMRNLAIELLGQNVGIDYIAGTAESTTLNDHSIDLIVAANAYHRFQPEETMKEFRRILKPNGMLAVISYYDSSNFLRDNMLITGLDEYHKRLSETRHKQPVQYFFGDSKPERFIFEQEIKESWEEYWGANNSGMESPEEDEKWFEAFRDKHQERFALLENNGLITVKYATEVWLGQPKYN